MPRRPSIATLLKRIAASPMDAQLHQDLGVCYCKNGQMKKAKTAYDRSLELDPSDPWTHLYLGNWHYTMKAHRPALKCFQYAAKLIPDEAITFVCLGDAYAALGFDALATENYLRALDINPKDETAQKHWHKWQKNIGPEAS